MLVFECSQLPHRTDVLYLLTEADSLGGNLFWAAGFSVISDLPHRPQWPVKSHLFINAGRLNDMNKGNSPVVSAGLLVVI